MPRIYISPSSQEYNLGTGSFGTDAHPIFHSDRGFQYTNRVFHAKLEAAGMTQSMSRVAKCNDNGPIEGFWGIIKENAITE